MTGKKESEGNGTGRTKYNLLVVYCICQHLRVTCVWSPLAVKANKRGATNSPVYPSTVLDTILAFVGKVTKLNAILKVHPRARGVYYSVMPAKVRVPKR